MERYGRQIHFGIACIIVLLLSSVRFFGFIIMKTKSEACQGPSMRATFANATLMLGLQCRCMCRSYLRVIADVPPGKSTSTDRARIQPGAYQGEEASIFPPQLYI